MNNSSVSWHVGQWPPLAWLETAIKSAALLIGVTTGFAAIAVANFRWPGGVDLLQFILLLLLALGLAAAIFDRIADREIVAMGFVILNNLGHWGMVLGLVTISNSPHLLWLFAALMLVGDLVKVWFIRTHGFTVRDYSQQLLVGLTAIYIVGYGLILLLEMGG